MTATAKIRDGGEDLNRAKYAFLSISVLGRQASIIHI